MIRWIRRLWWKRQRQIDLEILWPECKRLAPDIDHARAAFACHAMADRAWVCEYGKDLVRVIGELR